jgi:Spy/CpxP family protein refolding chaperone
MKKFFVGIMALALLASVWFMGNSFAFGTGNFGPGPNPDFGVGKPYKGLGLNYEQRENLQLERMKEKLNLTDNQVAQIKTILDDKYAKLKVLRTKLWNLRNDYRNLVANKADTSLLESKIKEINNTRIEMMNLNTDYRIKILDILTPEQRILLSMR